MNLLKIFTCIFKARGGVQGQKLDFLYFLTVKSSTFNGIITFYRMKISFDTLKILSAKVRTYCQIYGIFNTNLKYVQFSTLKESYSKSFKDL